MRPSRFFETLHPRQWTAVILLITALSACTNLHTVELDRSNPQQPALPIEVQIGDVLQVRDTSGDVTKFKLLEVDGNTLRGTRWDNKRTPVEISLATIDTLEVRRTDARANTTWGWGVILFLMASAAASP